MSLIKVMVHLFTLADQFWIGSNLDIGTSAEQTKALFSKIKRYIQNY